MTRAELYLKIYGPLKFGCGPSSNERTAQNQQENLATTMSNNYSTLFGEQQNTINQLNTLALPFASMAQAGEGFSPTALAAMNTNIIDTTGANYANATRAANTALAGRGGGGTAGIISGPEAQIGASIASQAAGQQSAEQQNLAIQNAQQVYKNAQTAASIEGGVAGLESPNAAGSGAAGGYQSAFNEANTIDQQSNQAMADIVGGAVGLGTSFLGGGIGNLDTTGGSSTGEQFGNFFSGGLSGLEL